MSGRWLRRVALFLALVALGAGILWWVGRGPGGTRPTREPVREGPEPRGEMTEVPGEKGQTIRTALSGPLDIYGRGRDEEDPTRTVKRYQLTSRDSRTLGEGLYEATGVHFHLFDPPKPERQAHVTAERAVLRIRAEPGVVELDREHPIDLETTVAEYEASPRFAPVIVRVPRLRTRIDLESATSDDQVDIRGNGLHATGRGLEVQGVARSMVIREASEAEVTLEDGRIARLSSRGPLAIRSLDPEAGRGPDSVEIEARDKAALRIEGEQPLALEADLVVLWGRIERGGSSRFVPTAGHAEGNVTLRPSKGVFTAERAEITFDDEGRAQHAALDGAPELAVELESERLPTELEGDVEMLTVELDGAGPLELFWEQPERFLFTGPAHVDVSDLGVTLATLDCDGSISGTLEEGARFQDLVAETNVRAEYGKLKLACPWLKLGTFRDEDDRPGATLESRGSTVIEGELDDGRPFELTADDGLDVQRSRKGFRVPIARKVSLAIRGDEGLEAKADVLRDLDVESNSFVAEGNVEFGDERGRSGRGDRYEAWAIDRGELSGTQASPAHFDFEGGWFEARYVELSRSLIQARGGARAQLEYEGLAYELGSRWAVLHLHPEREDRLASSDLELQAGGGVHVTQTSPEMVVRLDADAFRAQARKIVDEVTKEERYEPEIAVARGDVEFTIEGAATEGPRKRLDGSGHRLVLRGDRTGRLEPADEVHQVHLTGSLEGQPETFDLDAKRIDFAPDWLFAADPVIELRGLDLGFGTAAAEGPPVRIVAGRMALDRVSATFSEGVSFQGASPDLGEWSLDSRIAFLHRKPQEPEEPAEPGSEAPEPAQALQDLIASGGVTVSIEKAGSARAHTLSVLAESRTMSLSGSEAEGGERDVVLERADLSWRAPKLDLDLQSGFVRSDGGEVRSAPEEDAPSWTLSYEAIEPIVTGGETIQILRNPSWVLGDTEVRANWALLWLDAAEWNKLSTGDDSSLQDPDALRLRRMPQRLRKEFPVEEAARWVHEIYLDGDVEYRVQGVRKARGEGMYFDLVEGHGWMRDFVLDVAVPLGSRTYELKLQARWLRISADGTLQARNTIATTCSHDVPHYVIRNKGFTVKPRYKTVVKKKGKSGEEREVEELDGWDLSLDGNEITFFGGLRVPLPRIAGPMDPEFEFDRDALTVGNFRLPSFGSDSKFGTFIATTFTTDIGWFGRGFHWIFNRMVSPDIDLPKIRGDTDTSVRLMSRGIDVNVETEFESPGVYSWATLLDAIYDTGEDHGLVRVDEDDRSEGRAWFRTRGRVFLGAREWLDAVLTYQTDPGVQAEFFEGDYIRYEERETYLHWRRAEDTRYWSATIEARLEDFRTEIVDQPALGLFDGRREVGSIGSLPVVSTSNVSLEHLARFDGDPRYEAPFPDGLGDRDVLRVDVGQRLETPWAPGVLGLKLTPFLEARATGWSENQAEDDVASRAALIGGAVASTTFWRTFANGSRHVLTPSLSIRDDFASADDSLPVVFFDATDLPLEGRVYEAAIRSRWEHRELKTDLDVELRQPYAEDLPPGFQEGWQPLSTRLVQLSVLRGVPFGISHDARYDIEDAETDYSRTLFGFEPVPGLDVEAGYHTARDLAGIRLYNAASIGVRYPFSHKWEIEGRETISIKDNDDRLASALTLRRFGHDFVLEIETSVVAGEGAGSLHVNIQPLFLWRRSELSMLDRWRARRR